MNVKLLIGIIGRPWFIEPGAALEYAGLASDMIRMGGLEASDKMKLYSEGSKLEFGATFRVNERGAILYGQMAKEGPVQVFRINYPIAKYDYCGDPGSQTMQRLITAADADPSVKSIVLWIDSPGGQVDGTEALANTVKSLKKPVVAYTDGLMASAAYWIGSSADEIISQGSNNGWNETIGSIGTMVMWKDESGKFEKDGIKIHTVFATESKDKWGTMREMQNGNYTRIIQELDGLNDSFLNAIKSNRAGKINLEKENVLTGKTYNSKEALKAGLIDRIGSFETAVKRSLNISKKQQLSKMAFEKSLAVAKVDSFSVVAEGDSAEQSGFILSEESLTNIEALLASSEQSIAEANTARQTAEDALATAQASLRTAEANAATATQALETANARIAELEAAAGTFSESGKPSGEKPSGEQVKEIHPVTAEANRLRAMRGLPPIQ